MVIERGRRLFTVDDYERLIETGFFRPEERMELVDGEIVTMNPIGMRHAACVVRLTAILSARFRSRALVSVQNPIVLAERDEPQPDVAVVRRRDDYYATSRPRPADVLLLIEVADTTRGYDRSTKVPRYGAAGVSEVWLADLQRDVVLLNRGPAAGGYTTSRTARRGEQLAPILLPEVHVAVDEILG